MVVAHAQGGLMELCKDPECPFCGCCQSEEFVVRSWGAAIVRRRCDNCFAEFAPTPPQRPQKPVTTLVEFVAIRCPACESKNVRVRRSMPERQGRLRYHQCSDCQQNFRSFER